MERLITTTVGVLIGAAVGYFIGLPLKTYLAHLF